MVEVTNTTVATDVIEDPYMRDTEPANQREERVKRTDNASAVTINFLRLLDSEVTPGITKREEGSLEVLGSRDKLSSLAAVSAWHTKANYVDKIANTGTALPG